ncbi:hypothetical protein [Burkholderia gladioli]|uniref:hypothetical protein n=1 Tax=Burkholderia gladioli TaxID=28095 RepID=UPI00163EB805|nr:hypothetical protein [Burkholderia gladioli]
MAPSAVVAFVPPEANPIGDDRPAIVPPLMVAEPNTPEVKLAVGPDSAPDSVPPERGSMVENALFNCDAVSTWPGTNCAFDTSETASSASANNARIEFLIMGSYACGGIPDYQLTA